MINYSQATIEELKFLRQMFSAQKTSENPLIEDYEWIKGQIYEIDLLQESQGIKEEDRY